VTNKHTTNYAMERELTKYQRLMTDS